MPEINMPNPDPRLVRFVTLLEDSQRAEQARRYPNITTIPAVRAIAGKRYIRVDLGHLSGDWSWSGRYMIDTDGTIYGIKAYGVVHKGHRYGTLDTFEEWGWGDYRARRK